MGRRRGGLALILALLLAGGPGCAHYRVNVPLAVAQPQVAPGHRLAEERDDDLLLVLAFSGGGLRSAALAYGVLEVLRDVPIERQGRTESLLDQVDMISAVSSGSFVAAYYGLFGGRIFDEFEARFLKADLQNRLARSVLAPPNWFRLLSDTYDRVDLAAEYIDRNLFEGLTFADLAERSRTATLINATDLVTGERFEFTQAQFDLICSDLDAFPVARAVAASSAFPFLLSPVRLRNYAGRCDYRPPEWLVDAEDESPDAPRRHAEALRSYLDAGARPYIHLLDGGISDNLGLRSVLDALAPRHSLWAAPRGSALRSARDVAVIVVNGGAAVEPGLSRDERSPGLRDTFRAVTSAQVNRYNDATMDLARRSLEAWLAEAAVARLRGGGEPMSARLHLVSVNLDELPRSAERDALRALPTNFSLEARDVDRVREAAHALLHGSPEFARLTAALQDPRGQEETAK
jgi:NTE family protein